VSGIGSLRDACLGRGYWRQFYTPAEVDAIVQDSASTAIVSGNQPVRFHAVIDFAGAGYTVTDIGSRYGVYLNGERMPMHPGQGMLDQPSLLRQVRGRR
jgi:hypothetical protein